MVERVGILFEYRNEKAIVACQTLLYQYHATQVKNFVNKEVVSKGFVPHRFTSVDFNETFKSLNKLYGSSIIYSIESRANIESL